MRGRELGGDALGDTLADPLDVEVQGNEAGLRDKLDGLGVFSGHEETSGGRGRSSSELGVEEKQGSKFWCGFQGPTSWSNTALTTSMSANNLSKPIREEF